MLAPQPVTKGREVLLSERVSTPAHIRLASVFPSICSRHDGKPGSSKKLCRPTPNKRKDLSEAYIRLKAEFAGFFPYAGRQIKSRTARTDFT